MWGEGAVACNEATQILFLTLRALLLQARSCERDTGCHDSHLNVILEDVKRFLVQFVRMRVQDLPIPRIALSSIAILQVLPKRLFQHGGSVLSLAKKAVQLFEKILRECYGCLDFHTTNTLPHESIVEGAHWESVKK